jgi:hypothetical protein
MMTDSVRAVEYVTIKLCLVCRLHPYVVSLLAGKNEALAGCCSLDFFPMMPSLVVHESYR